MKIRKPAVAGQFYPSDPVELREMVERFIRDASTSTAPDTTSTIVAPHAGYVYSGATAGHAFARIQGKKPDRVVLLGPSHRYGFDGISVLDAAAAATPLGELPIDAAFSREVSALANNYSPQAHVLEHSLEVELPFLQVAIGPVPVVMVLFGASAAPWHYEFAASLVELMDESTLLVLSTDLSHYLSESQANTIDLHTLQAVLLQDYEAVSAEVDAGTCSMCGATAVITGMAASLKRGATEWKLLDYSTSARASGDTQRVVGYGALSMEWAKP